MNEEKLKTYEVTIKFLCEVRDREDALARTRLMFGDLPLPGLRIDAARAPVELERRLVDRDLAKSVIERDLDQGASFVRDIMGVPEPPPPHPWKQGLWIFPDTHPLAAYERAAKAQNDTRALDAMRELKGGQHAIEAESGHESSGSGGGADTEDHDSEVVEDELLGE